MLDSKLESSLLENTNFKDYKSAFIKTNEYKKLIESKNYKDSAYKKDLEDKAFINYARNIEKQKLLYFALCLNHQVLIIKSPQDNKEQKKFLGYEWSNRKGDEGLKELNSPYITPLFERENLNNPNKLSFLIKQSFLKNEFEIPNELEKYASKAKLVDMIDFSKVEFDKAISLNPVNKVFLNPFANCKYELVRLCEIKNIDIKKGTSITQKQTKQGNIKVVAGGLDYAYFHNEANRPKNTITISASGANAGFVNFWNEEIFASDCTTINANSEVTIKFIYYILQFMQTNIYQLARGAAQPHVYPKDIENIQIPELDTKIQQQIVRECEKVEEQYNTIRMSIEKYQELIKAILVKCGIIANNDEFMGGKLNRLDSINSFIVTLLESIKELESKLDYTLLACHTELLSEVSQSAKSKRDSSIDISGIRSQHDKIDSKEYLTQLKTLLDSIPTPPQQSYPQYRLSDKYKFNLQIGKRVLDSELNPQGQIPVYSANVKKPFGYIDKELLKDYERDSVLWGIDGDWMVGFIPRNTPFYPTDHCGVLQVKDNNIKAKIVSFVLDEAGKRVGFSRNLRASIERIGNLQIPLPPLEAQEKIISAIETIESKISALESRNAILANAKNEILNKYLF